MQDKLYEEAHNSYRFFLSWRHASVVGIFVVFYGVLSLCVMAFKDAEPLAWIIPIIASPVGVIFWLIDKRTQKLYQAAISAGKELEKDKNGFFTKLKDDVSLKDGVSSFSQITHRGILSVTFLGSSIILIFIGVIIKLFY